MKNFRLLSGIFTVLFVLLCYSYGQAETLAWNAPTTYTDGSAIGTAAVTYTARWSTSLSLTNPHTLASAISGLSTTFNVDTEGMVRGSTIYFGVYATVATANSADGTLLWVVSYKVPTAPGNLRIQ